MVEFESRQKPGIPASEALSAKVFDRFVFLPLTPEDDPATRTDGTAPPIRFPTPVTAVNTRGNDSDIVRAEWAAIEAQLPAPTKMSQDPVDFRPTREGFTALFTRPHRDLIKQAKTARLTGNVTHELANWVGIEPTSSALTGRRSATELRVLFE